MYDALFLADFDFLAHTDKTSKKFDSKESEFKKTRLYGLRIDSKDDGYIVHQERFTERL